MTDGHILATFPNEALKTVVDLAPILALIVVVQLGFIRRPIPGLPRILLGLLYVAIGLTLFRIGIAETLIPIGRDMAHQLVDAAASPEAWALRRHLPILAFAAAIGFTATLIEPTLTAAAERVEDLSGGALRARLLRLVVAGGVALGLLLGTLRIVHGVPLAYLLAAISLGLIALALTAPRQIVPLALDSGAIATSVVTVPLIAAYGAAVAEALPNDATAADGFGLIVLALLMPVLLILVLAHVQERATKRAKRPR